MITHVLGIDPGESTGVALWSMREKFFTYIITLNAHEAVSLAWLTISERKSEDQKLIVVCEKFIISKRTLKSTPQHDPIEITGALRHACLNNPNVSFFQFQPSDAKNALPIIKHKLYDGTKYPDSHGVDAACQVAQYLKCEHPKMVKEVLQTRGTR